ncbi:MAG: 50S ribosomal protein L29 [Planctomycetes bacterium]|nr:50S ribosomal protein L29 [Planctomycetota bacterium]
MKLNELRRLTDQELLREADDRMKELFNLRYQSGTEQLENPSRIRHARREVARIKTLLRERELEKKA